MSEQHDHHCLLVFHGEVWRIGACEPRKIFVHRSTPDLPGARLYMEIDTSRVDFAAYCEAALAYDERAAAGGRLH